MDVCPIRMDIDTCFIKIENYETKQVIDFIEIMLNLLIVSCEDPNNWGYDPNYDNMYRPIHFDIVEESIHL